VSQSPFSGFEEYAEGSFGDFVAERNEALLSVDLRRFVEFLRRYHIQVPRTRLGVLVGLHKAREATFGLPEEARQESRQWLIRNGYLTLREGEQLRRN
jgi:hypothetical protein